VTAEAVHDYDVIMLSDLQLPGGTSSSLAEEIAAQARGGYRTAMIHVPRLPRRLLPMNPKLQHCVHAGLCDLVTDLAPLRCRLLVVRHPGVFAAPPDRLPRLRADVKVMVVNQAPSDDAGSAPYYDLAEVERNLITSLGGGFSWVPIGPLVRESLVRARPDLPLLPDDWVNTLDVDDWAVERPPLADRRPVIGRHSRPHFRKWPNEAADILAAYPDTPNMLVKVLGGAEAPQQVLGYLPRSWTVYPFNAMSVKRFLAQIDFFVYFHHPGLVEAFGRAPLEALASGAITVLPPHFEELFGEAAVYGMPQDVQGIVLEYARDARAHAEQVERGQAFVRRHFGATVATERVAALIGEPTGARRVSVRSSGDGRTPVLFASSNGAGVGHLTRLMAMARRTSSAVRPVFFTLSQAVSVVRSQGFLCEYLSPSAYLGCSAAEWHAVLHERLNEMLRIYRPAVVVFDGTRPFQGLQWARNDHQEVPFVWSRRAMWKEGFGEWSIAQSGSFDMVLEPGELAASYDRGLTTQVAHPVHRVGPITLLDRDELLDAREAKERLGLRQDQLAALVTLGAGNINDIDVLAEDVVRHIQTSDEVQVCVTDPVIAERRAGGGHGVHRLSVYPLSRYLRAFDFAVSAAGYNSFHELVGFGVPTLFIPNRQTSMDDQAARARFVRDQGAALSCDDAQSGCVEDAVARLLDPAERAALQRACDRLHRGNGAEEATRAIERLALPWRRDEPLATVDAGVGSPS